MDPVDLRISRQADSQPLFPEIGSNYEAATLRSVGILEGGMQNGKTSLWFNVQLASGRWICTQVSASMLEMIAGAVRGAEQRWATEPRRN